MARQNVPKSYEYVSKKPNGTAANGTVRLNGLNHDRKLTVN